MATPPDSRLRELLDSPEFQHRFWQFVHDAPDVPPSSIDFLFAVRLVSTLKHVWAEAFIAKGVPESAAQARVERAITEQRDFYAVLAGTPQPGNEIPG